MTREELATRQTVACQVLLEPAAFARIDHEAACDENPCGCDGTAWFRGLTMVVGVDADLMWEAHWLM